MTRKHKVFVKDTFIPHLIPPRLYDNVKCKFAKIYDWSDNLNSVENWIHNAFNIKDKINPNNSRELYKNNRTGSQWQ